MKHLCNENSKTVMKNIGEVTKGKNFPVQGLEELILAKCSYYVIYS
jgi:hypothetical protein